MKIHATDGERRTERIHCGGTMSLVIRIDYYRSLCGRWLVDETDVWADSLDDVTCRSCRRVLAARGEAP